MQIGENIYAKSKENGGVPLIDHLKHVALVAELAAFKLGLDVTLAKKGAILHDIGKTHPSFQQRLISSKNIEMGIPFRHEIASLFFIPLFYRDDWDALIDMIIAHHRSLKQDNRGQGLLDLVNMEGIEPIFNRHFDPWEKWSSPALEILSRLGINVRPIMKEEVFTAYEYVIKYCSLKKYGWSKWKGILIGSDHFASAVNYNTNEYLTELFDVPDLSLFEKRVNKVYPLSLISGKNNAPHTLVIAPTGAGKTDFLMKRCTGRVFYTLPFQASINAMYERFKTLLPDQKGIRLLHAASKVSIQKDNSYEEKVIQDKFGASIKVLTPHQLASLICGTRGFEVVGIDIAGTDVILDEIHTYSDVSQSMVLEIIKTLLKLNCKIHIGSATMPSILQEKILEILNKERTYIVKLSDKTLDTFNRHLIKKCSSFEEVIPAIKAAINRNEKILVVCNKVDAAQQKYELCSQLFPDIPQMLIHSRFKRKDRNSLEKKLQDNFNNSLQACIVVSTQVLEVSLDISFDIMVTECAPIDSLIQRFGRINRKRTEDSLQLQLFKPIYVIIPPESKKDCLPYSMEKLQKSFYELPDNEVLNERDLQSKIDIVYPDMKITSIDTHLVWDKEDFLLTELCHYPSSVLMETLSIDSAAAICFSDKEKYETCGTEERANLEIPIPRNARFRKFTNFGYSKYGTCPVIIHDDLYDSEKGLTWKEIDTFM